MATAVETTPRKASGVQVRALRRFWKSSEVSIIKLAAAFGCTQGYLSLLLSGDRPLTTEQVRRLRELIIELARKDGAA